MRIWASIFCTIVNPALYPVWSDGVTTSSLLKLKKLQISEISVVVLLTNLATTFMLWASAGTVHSSPKVQRAWRNCARLARNEKLAPGAKKQVQCNSLHHTREPARSLSFIWTLVVWLEWFIINSGIYCSLYDGNNKTLEIPCNEMEEIKLSPVFSVKKKVRKR